MTTPTPPDPTPPSELQRVTTVVSGRAPAPLQAWTFHVTADLTASADITVLAHTRAEAEDKVQAQGDLRASQLTSELAESVSAQVRTDALDLKLDLEDVRPATPEDQDLTVSSTDDVGPDTEDPEGWG